MTWGYGINQWKRQDQFVRREDHQRAFQTIAACGFVEVELTAGSGRFESLGRPDRIVDNYSSVQSFLDILHHCGLERVSSFFFDPGQPIVEEPSFGRNPANPADRDGIVASTRPFAEFLTEVGGSTLVVRPADSYWRVGQPTSEQLDEIAATWNAVAAMTAPLGVAPALHLDALSAIQTMEQIDLLLARTEPSVKLALDTAELTLLGLDPLQLFERHADRVGHLHLKDVKQTDPQGERLGAHAERDFLSAGGSRGIGRWFWELGTEGGLVDFPKLLAAVRRAGYSRSIIVESDHSPDPAGSTMLNGWYVQHVLA